MQRKKIAIMIPCHNEEQGIRKVLESIPVKKLHALGFLTQVIVINNNSNDRTVEFAKKFDVQILHESKRGKGNAIMRGFQAIKKNVDYVVMLDGDNTYNAAEIPRMIEPLESGFCDIVVGSRLSGRMMNNSLRFPNRVANWVYTFLVRQIYRANITDVLSGFFAWRREVTDDLTDHIESRGFSIEMDMITKSVKLGYSLCSVPITYDVREGESKIEALADGLKIMAVLFFNFIYIPNVNFSRRTRILSVIKSPFISLNRSFQSLYTFFLF